MAEDVVAIEAATWLTDYLEEQPHLASRERDRLPLTMVNLVLRARLPSTSRRMPGAG